MPACPALIHNMATRKRKTRKRARRRVGAMSLNPNSPLMKLAAVGVGYLLADTINPQIDNLTKSFLPTTTTVPASGTTPASVTANKTNTEILAAAEAGLGALLLLGKKGNWIKTVAGGIVAGAGLKRGLKSFGVISGYQSVPVIGGRRVIRGYQKVPVIGNINTPAQLQGYRVNGPSITPPQLSGYRVNRVMGSTGSGYAQASTSGYMN